MQPLAAQHHGIHLLTHMALLSREQLQLLLKIGHDLALCIGCRLRLGKFLLCQRLHAALLTRLRAQDFGLLLRFFELRQHLLLLRSAFFAALLPASQLRLQAQYALLGILAALGHKADFRF